MTKQVFSSQRPSLFFLSHTGKAAIRPFTGQSQSLRSQVFVTNRIPKQLAHTAATQYRQPDTKKSLSTTTNQSTTSQGPNIPPRILIFGTGSIGAVYAWVLSRQVPTSNIVCVCRSNYTAAKENGFTIKSTLRGNNLNVKPTIVRSVEEASTLSASPFDYIIITSKALTTTPPTADIIKPAVSPNTTIVLIQNGIGIEQPYKTSYPTNPLLSTVVYLPATQTSPGTVSHAEIENLHIGTYPSDAPLSHKTSAQALCSLLTSCNATAKVHDDVQSQRWSKLLVNASWNAICAITRSRDVEFLRASPISEDITTAYVRDVMREISRIARACGYEEVNENLIDFQIKRASKRDLPGIEPSMLADAKAGRRMEVEAIMGNALRIAGEKGFETPLLRGLYLLLSGLDGSFEREIGKDRA